MATFYTASNNGVVAIVTEATYQKMEERTELFAQCEKKKLPTPQLPSITPVFTFARPGHPAFKYMTGSNECLTKLLENHETKDGMIWVPFSNGVQWRGGEEAEWELEFITSLDEALEAFGLEVG